MPTEITEEAYDTIRRNMVRRAYDNSDEISQDDNYRPASLWFSDRYIPDVLLGEGFQVSESNERLYPDFHSVPLNEHFDPEHYIDIPCNDERCLDIDAECLYCELDNDANEHYYYTLHKVGECPWKTVKGDRNDD